MADDLASQTVAVQGESIGAMPRVTTGEGGSHHLDALDSEAELVASCAAFHSSLPPAMRTGFADPVRR